MSETVKKYTVCGRECEYDLMEEESDRDGGRWRNGVLTAPDGSTHQIGGGDFHDADSAALDNARCGLACQDQNIYWPGAAEPGDFLVYEDYERYSSGIEEVLVSLGVGITEETEQQLIADLQSAAGREWSRMESSDSAER